MPKNNEVVFRLDSVPTFPLALKEMFSIGINVGYWKIREQEGIWAEAVEMLVEGPGRLDGGQV